MNDTQDLTAIVDECVDDILLGQANLATCLKRWPEAREELEPLLRTALEVASLPVPSTDVMLDPARHRRRRAEFMALIRETPQEQSRFRLPALPSLGSIGSMALGASALRFASVAAPALLVAVVAIALVWSTSPRAASAATLTVFSGQVERLEGDKWVPVEDGAPVKEGDTIRTADGSFAMVTFPDGSTATVDAATRLAFEDITVDGERQISIRQESGRIWNDVVPIEGGDSYVIHTPHAVVRAHGTVFETFVDSTTAVATAEGLVSLAATGLEDSVVEVGAGQIVRTTPQGISAPEEVRIAGEIQIDGPVVGYITTPSGAATGVLLNGLVFRQIPGIVSSDVETSGASVSQRFTFGDAELGEYSLVLRRYAQGEASVTLDTGGSDLSISVPDTVAIARLPIEVASASDGKPAVRTLSSELESVGEAPQVRVVESKRSRSASDIAAIISGSSGTASPTATHEAVAAATRSNDHTSPSDDPSRGEQPNGSGTAKPHGGSASEAWNAQLGDALKQGDRRQIESVVREALEGDDGTRAERLAALAAAMSNPHSAEQVRGGISEGLSDRIIAESTRVAPEVADKLESGLHDEGGHRGNGGEGSNEDRGSGNNNGRGNEGRGNGGNEGGRDGDRGRGDDRGGDERWSWVPDWVQGTVRRLHEEPRVDSPREWIPTPTPSPTKEIEKPEPTPRTRWTPDRNPWDKPVPEVTEPPAATPDDGARHGEHEGEDRGWRNDDSDDRDRQNDRGGWNDDDRDRGEDDDHRNSDRGRDRDWDDDDRGERGRGDGDRDDDPRERGSGDRGRDDDDRDRGDDRGGRHSDRPWWWGFTD